MIKSRYWEKKGKRVHCLLCPHRCVIPENKTGVCGVRKNVNGKIIPLNKISSVNVDSIEKKPFYTFLPKTKTLSFGTFGCNFKCYFCQNWGISQETWNFANKFGKEISSEDFIRMALKNNCKSISSTYNEPTVSFELTLDFFKKAKEKGLKTLIVSNGFINKEPLKELLEYTDAFNIDLKSFDNNFYRKICGGKLQPVLNSIKMIKKANKHLEITNLIIENKNDNLKEIRKMCQWIKKNADCPLHFSRFFPHYKMKDIKPTSIETLNKCKEIALDEGIKKVYLGNV